MDSTTLAEAAIFAVALSSFSLSVWSLVVTHEDHAALHRLRINGIKRITISARMVRDICRTVGTGILLVSAGWCLVLPPDTDTVAVILKYSTLLLSLTMLLTILMDQHWRRVLEREFRHLEDERG
jgi:hypothetical protein